MKNLRIYSSAVLAIMLLLNTETNCQTVSKPVYVDLSKMEMRCAVAHGTKDGWFVCDFKGTYYPEQIFDSTIRKWFIKIENGDSLFYYRHDVVKLYIWNGRPKNEAYGYESEGMRNTGSGITIPDKYTTDTLRFKEQVWKPKD